MPQAGIHAITGLMGRKWAPHKELLSLGVVLGTMAPDLDNLAVAIATLTGGNTEGLHRTFSHSFIIIGALVVVFYLVAAAAKRPEIGNLGLGLGLGISAHIMLDLVAWFNGVHLLWPMDVWVNLWENVTPPAWWMDLMLPAEFLMFAVYFLWMANEARKKSTNTDMLTKLRTHTNIQLGLFILFTVLLYTLKRATYMIPYGALYLVSLIIALSLTVKMRDTIEIVSQ